MLLRNRTQREIPLEIANASGQEAPVTHARARTKGGDLCQRTRMYLRKRSTKSEEAKKSQLLFTPAVPRRERRFMSSRTHASTGGKFRGNGLFSILYFRLFPPSRSLLPPLMFISFFFSLFSSPSLPFVALMSNMLICFSYFVLFCYFLYILTDRERIFKVMLASLSHVLQKSRKKMKKYIYFFHVFRSTPIMSLAAKGQNSTYPDVTLSLNVH